MFHLVGLHAAFAGSAGTGRPYVPAQPTTVNTHTHERTQTHKEMYKQITTSISWWNASMQHKLQTWSPTLQIFDHWSRLKVQSETQQRLQGLQAHQCYITHHCDAATQSTTHCHRLTCTTHGMTCAWFHIQLLDIPHLTGRWMTLTMADLCNRGPLYFCPVVSSIYLSSFFSSPNLSCRRLDVYHTSTHGVALVRI